jgi:putative ABC transport system substrate-binding protein
MDRRTLIRGAATAAVVLATAARAQPRTRVPRIGILSPYAPLAPPSPNHEAFREALRELGYVDGKTMHMEFRSAQGTLERLPALAVELVRLDVDIIVTNGEPAIRAAKNASSSVAVVMAIAGDPVETGLVTSLARPGGNVTGLTNVAAGLNRKRLEVLKEAFPNVVRVAVMRYRGEPVRSAVEWSEVQAAAAKLELQLSLIDVANEGEFERAFDTLRKLRAEALMPLVSPFFFFHRTRIAELVASHRLPAIYEQRQYVEAGGLMSYGPDIMQMWRRAAVYVDRIVKGARPADIPIEQPPGVELVINARTARAAGFSLPASLMQRADEVIT